MNQDNRNPDKKDRTLANRIIRFFRTQDKSSISDKKPVNKPLTAASIGISGLTVRSKGQGIKPGVFIKKRNPSDKVIALAGNPNVGKSTVFNALTGLKQHTGNWPGKTVANAQGYCSFENQGYVFVDLPGCYSLMSHSAEEEIARNFICFEHPDAVIVVCDATCLERNLNLILQIREITDNMIICANMMDEVKKKKIELNLLLLSQKLQVPVIPMAAGRGRSGLDSLLRTLQTSINNRKTSLSESGFTVNYPEYIESSISKLIPVLKNTKLCSSSLNIRWLALRLIEQDENFICNLAENLDFNGHNTSLISPCQIQMKKTSSASSSNFFYDYLQSNPENNELINVLTEIEQELLKKEISKQKIQDDIVCSIVNYASEISTEITKYNNMDYNIRDRKIDKILTSKRTGFPVMIVLLMLIFWITISASNYPSQLISNLLFSTGDKLMDFSIWLGIPIPICELVFSGIYRVLAWVISVMLPPMAIFFPLFTLLEDIGYLPRIAFNLDKYYKKCDTCGKQALTTCMGFGCNAAGVVGCRIIDSPRERLIAIITNKVVHLQRQTFIPFIFSNH